MMDITLVILIAVATVALIVFAVWRARASAQQWREQVEGVARRFRLKAYLPDYAICASADGTTDHGHDVSLSRSTRSRLGSDFETHYYEIKVRPRGGPGSMTIKARDNSTDAFRDFSQPAKKNRTGVDAIDKRFHVDDRHRGMCKRLQDPTTQAAFLSFLEGGGHLDHGVLVFESTYFPKEMEELMDRIDRTIALAERLAAPGG